ncbi:phage-related minor tail family protein [Clostridioides difficile 824]|uniref:phage tail tape measure protein n=1 Tax=Clostridioides difficile TaxID=1496 RepID=UPI00038D3EC6|nr:phage tail tape measure protein [Clostridioides difficile]HDN2469778.1 phage tail tape measure protein [Clostridioides difficile CD196]EGT4171490.1 phage tail tape measure protein [Clostridioides difficile]EGT4658535.1 phage tail tape measure protein [Clostridioides difficile]EGT4721064.1 phage tail tape measure protein [Clostridioides difficile]EGT5007862.1 phage tail tape measure protein [Clostridioides difficile]
MSAGSRALEAVIRMRDEASRTLRQVRDATRALQNQTDTTSQAQERLQEQLKKVGEVASKACAGLGAGVLSIGGMAIKANEDYQKALNQIQASTGNTVQGMEHLKDAMLGVYKNNFGEDFADIANAMSIVDKSLAGATGNIQSLTEKAIGFRDTFGYEVSESIRSADALVRNFGISGDEAFNLMAQGQQRGLDYSGELLDNINEYSVQFKKLGLSATDMFNLFESGMNAGAFNLDKIGDAIKEFSIRAIDGSNTTIDGFNKLGMNAEEMGAKFAKGGVGAKTAFYQVIEAIKNVNDPVKQSIIGVDLFGTMWEDLGPQVVTQLGSIKNKFDETKNTMDEINKIKYASFSQGLQGIGRIINAGVLIPLGQRMLPALNEFANWLKNDGVKSINSFANEIGNGLSGAVKLATKALPLLINSLSWVLKNGPTIASIFVSIKTASIMTSAVKSIVALKKAWVAAKLAVRVYMVGMAEAGTVLSGFQILVGVLTKNMTIAQARTMLLAKASALLGGPIGIAIVAITALVAGLVVLWNTNKGFRDFVINAWNNIKETATKVWGSICNFFTQTIPQAWESLCTGFSNAGQWFGELWNNIKQAFISGWNAIVAFFTQTIPMWINSIGIWFNQLPTKIGYALGFTLGKIISWGISVWTYLVTNVPIWINNVVTFFAQLPSRIWTWLVSTVQKIGQWGMAMITYAQIYARMIINNIIVFFQTLPSRVWTWLTNTVQKVVSWGSQMATKGKEGAKKLINTVVDTLKSLPKKVMDIGKNIVKGLWNGITGAGGWLKGKVNDFAKGVIDGFKNGFGVHSPSWKLRDLVGRFLPLGIWEGIKVELPSLKSNIDNVVSNLTQRMYKPQEIEESDYTRKYKEAIAQRTEQNTINKTDSKTTNNKEDNNITININLGGVTVKEEADINKLTKMLVREIKLGIAGGV